MNATTTVRYNGDNWVIDLHVNGLAVDGWDDEADSEVEANEKAGHLLADYLEASDELAAMLEDAKVDAIYCGIPDAYDAADAGGNYDYMLENIDIADLRRAGMSAADFVEDYAKTAISVTNQSGVLSDAQMLEAWKRNGDYIRAVNYVQSEFNEFDLEQVMTPAEIESEFNLAEGTVRQAINRERLPARKADERTWLVHRKDALARWGKRKQQ